jgi:hypothetical protein
LLGYTLPLRETFSFWKRIYYREKTLKQQIISSWKAIVFTNKVHERFLKKRTLVALLRNKIASRVKNYRLRKAKLFYDENLKARAFANLMDGI